MAVTIAVCVGVTAFFVLLFDDTIAEIRDIFEIAGIAVIIDKAVHVEIVEDKG